MIFPSATGGNGPDYIQWISQEAPITAQTYLYPDTASHWPAPQLNIQISTWAVLPQRHYAFKYIAWPVCPIKDKFNAPPSFGYWKLLNPIFMRQNGCFVNIKTVFADFPYFCTRFALLFLTTCEESMSLCEGTTWSKQTSCILLGGLWPCPSRVTSVVSVTNSKLN